MLRQIKTSQRLPRLIAIKVNGSTPAITVGNFDATLVKNATGDYTLTLLKPFARIPVCVATCETATAYCEVPVSTASSVQVLVKNPGSGAAKDGVFHLLVMGFDAADQT